MDGQEVLKEPLPDLRALWEDTSFQLERLQADEACVNQEEEGLSKRTQPYFKLTFDPSDTPVSRQLGEIRRSSRCFDPPFDVCNTPGLLNRGPRGVVSQSQGLVPR